MCIVRKGFTEKGVLIAGWFLSQRFITGKYDGN